jgi:protein TonB
MHFDQNAHGTGPTLSRLLAVVVVHMVVGAAIVAGIAVKQKLPTHFMPDPITQIDKPIPPPLEPPVTNFDVNPINPPLVSPPPVVMVETAPADAITQVVDPSPPLVTKAGTAGGSGTGDTVKPVAKGKPILGKGSCDVPAYPANAAREGATGTVRLALLVGIHGRVTDARIEKTSGHRELDKAARAALSTCRFTPVTVDGVPEATWTIMEYIWTLDQ